MKVDGHKCDECGVMKQESNHWVLASVFGAALHLYPWDAEVPDKDRMLHLCGEGCAAKVQSKQIASWKLQPTEVRSE